jgi:pheromone shutdown-related protein TraB
MKNDSSNDPKSTFNSPSSNSSSEEFVSDCSISDSADNNSSLENLSTEESSLEISDIIIPMNLPASNHQVNLNTVTNSGNAISTSEDEIQNTDDPVKIIIIGTAHVSEESVREVREAIEKEKPDIVAVELDQGRYKGMTDPDSVPDQQLSFKEILKPDQMLYYLLYGFLAYFQRKMGEQMGVPPGSEMFAAIDGAHEIGADLALIDRDIQITFKRFLAKLSFMEKLKMGFSLLKGMIFGDDEEQEIDINDMTNQDVITAMIEEFRKFAPTAASVLIDERDAYLAGNILKTAQMAGSGKKIVVVIGAGHRQGIMNYLQNPSTIPDLKELTVIPKKRFSFFKFIGYGIFALFLLAFVYIIYSIISYPDTAPETLIFVFAIWILITGTLSAIGVFIAGGKFRSAVVAFSLAWFAALHPLFAAGWFAGLMEARIRKPTAKDIKSMMAIINSETSETFMELFRKLNQNSFFKVIFVTAICNVGCTVGILICLYCIPKIAGIDFGLLKTVFSGFGFF